MESDDRNRNRLVILGVAASDAHAVANQLIAWRLRLAGYEVVNLGACTPLEEFARAHAAHPEALAVLVGSLNGHAYQDLRALPDLRAAGLLDCPVVVGGNLSVGATKDDTAGWRLRQLGVDHIVTEVEALPALLRELAASRAAHV